MKANFDLDPVQWSRLRGLLDGALALAPAERATWIERLGPEDEDLKPRLRALLARAAGDSSPLDTLPHVETAPFLAERAQRGDGDALAPGAAVGPYRLIRPRGEGGMSAVWLAERTDMLQRRQVALKLPRLRLFVQVARAVAHARAQLVVHRDLKPANILVTEAGDVKLLEFGIAKLLEDGRAQETELTPKTAFAHRRVRGERREKKVLRAVHR